LLALQDRQDQQHPHLLLLHLGQLRLSLLLLQLLGPVQTALLYHEQSP
jgi:hypothetical protein